jgi:hypothetical protein
MGGAKKDGADSKAKAICNAADKGAEGQRVAAFLLAEAQKHAADTRAATQLEIARMQNELEKERMKNSSAQAKAEMHIKVAERMAAEGMKWSEAMQAAKDALNM